VYGMRWVYVCLCVGVLFVCVWVGLCWCLCVFVCVCVYILHTCTLTHTTTVFSSVHDWLPTESWTTTLINSSFFNHGGGVVGFDWRGRSLSLFRLCYNDF
jgi:type IV secretory pathway VirB3-like protein